MDEPIVDTKKKPRGKPFTGGDDPRRNRKGKPKTGESLAEKVRNALAEAKDEKNPDYTKLDALLDKMVT